MESSRIINHRETSSRRRDALDARAKSANRPRFKLPTRKSVKLVPISLLAVIAYFSLAGHLHTSIISTIGCDLLLIEQSSSSSSSGNDAIERPRRFVAAAAANSAIDQTAAERQERAMAGKVASLASKLEQWLQCQRLNLILAAQQEIMRANTTSISTALVANKTTTNNATTTTTTTTTTTQEAICQAHFDGHLCWPPSAAGATIKLACPRINYYAATHTSSPTSAGSADSEPPPQLKSVIDSIHAVKQANQSAQDEDALALAAAANLHAVAPTGNRAAINHQNGAGVMEALRGRLQEEEQQRAGQFVNKFARRQCNVDIALNTTITNARGQWQTSADYGECRQSTSVDLWFDPTDEWVKLDDPLDRKLMEILMEQLERIEVSIEPYVERDLLEQWQLCIAEIVRQQQQQQQSTANQNTTQCPIIFDGWRCWPATRAGDTAYVSCPSNQPGFSAERKAHKICTHEADWYRHPMTNRYWSNYTTCVDTVDLAFRTKILNLYIIGNLISLIALTISLIIFVSFKNLNCTRVTIHKNLFLSFITNNLMWVVWYTYVVNDANLLQSNPIGCRLWHILLHYFLVSNYFWMFCEGLYLHTLLVVAFVSEDKILKWFYLLGWLTPLPITLAYAHQRSYDEYYTNFCWMEESPHNIILMAPIGVSLLLNLVFLINIVRVLVTKLRANNSPDTHQTRKAVRATLILIPLLGLHYMLTPFRPEAKSEWEVYYEIIAAVCTSFQGLCVAMLFCFCNGEVLVVVRKKLKDTCWLERRRNSSKKFAFGGTMRSRSNTAISNCNMLSGGGNNYNNQRDLSTRNNSQMDLIISRHAFDAPASVLLTGSSAAGQQQQSSQRSSLLTTVSNNTESPVKVVAPSICLEETVKLLQLRQGPLEEQATSPLTTIS